MIVILEGLEGVGKTVAARALSRSLGLPVYRAFRPSNSGKYSIEDKRFLSRLAVPFNSYVDDLYVADFLAEVGGDVVLDRSMPSGYAYGLLYGNLGAHIAGEALGYWLQRMSVCLDVHYIHMHCDPRVAFERASTCSRDVDETRRLSNHMEYCHRLACDRFRALSVDTTYGGPSAMLGELSKHFNKEIT